MKLGALQQMARLEMNRAGLRGWSFTFDRGTSRFGNCSYNKRQISMSRSLSEGNSEEVCRNTLLHEIAHAVAGPRAGHGAAWQKICVELGGDGKQFYSLKTVNKTFKYTLTCPTCGKKFGRDRIGTRAVLCMKCHQQKLPCKLQWSDTKTGLNVATSF